jgi:hypothetical protein
MMTKNLGAGERALRLAAGVLLAAFALLAELEPGWALLLFLAGIGLLMTAFFRYCPVNALLKRGRDPGASALL